MAFGARERAIFAVAQAQQGLVTYAQLADAGVSKSLLQYRVKTGEWIRELPSLVRMYWAERSWLQSVWAAWLWAGPLSAISHSSAAVLNGLGFDCSGPIHVTLPERYSVRTPAPWVRIYRSRALSSRDVETTVGELRLTRPARTVLDLASQLPEHALATLIRTGVRLGTFSLAELHRYVAPLTQGRAGGAVLRRLLRQQRS